MTYLDVNGIYETITKIEYNVIIDLSNFTQILERYWFYLNFNTIYDVNVEYIKFPKNNSKIRYNMILTSYNLYTSSLNELHILFKNKYIYVDSLTKNVFLIDSLINSINNSFSVVIDYSSQHKRYFLLNEKKLQPYLRSLTNFFIYKENISINGYTLSDCRILPFESFLISKHDSDLIISQKLLNRIYGTVFSFEPVTNNINLLLGDIKISLNEYTVYSDLKNLKNSKMQYCYYTSNKRMSFDLYFNMDYKV